MKWFAALFLLPLLCSCTMSRHMAGPPPDLNLLTRADWNARPPVAEMKSHQPGYITLHHTASRQNPQRSLVDKMQGLQRFSQNEGKLASNRTKPAWPDVPYHFYIDCHGAVAEGRDVNFVGDTNTEYDPTRHVLVVLEGNFEEETVKDAQWASLQKLVTWLAVRYRVSPEKVQSHQDYAKTLCPGRDLHDRLNQLRQTLVKN